MTMNIRRCDDTMVMSDHGKKSMLTSKWICPPSPTHERFVKEAPKHQDHQDASQDLEHKIKDALVVKQIQLDLQLRFLGGHHAL